MIPVIFYLMVALFMTVAGSLMVNIEGTTAYQVEGMKQMIKWAWAWPVLVPIMLVKGFIKIVRS